MFFLNKMFKLRDKSNPDEEKPFLDHLEDLRVMVTRIALTLIIATLACFAYKDELMSIIRRPVEQVWVERHEASLPEGEDISLDDWERALSLAEVSAPLAQYNPELAEDWWAKVSDDRGRQLAEAAFVYRAAQKLPEDQREGFLEIIPDDQKEVRELALKFLESKPADNLNAEGNLRLMSSLKPTETFMLTMKLAFFAGLVISFPFLLYFVLQFIIPGLKDKERQALWPALLIGFGLFLGGVLFAYFYVLPNVLTFFYEWGQSMGISNDWRIGYYISFATTFVLIFGLAFELPVVVMTLVKIGVLSHSMMKETRLYAILAIFVIAAVITPTPDALTLSLLAVPMVILYEICIWLSYFHEKKVNRLEAAEEKERMERLLSSPDPDDEPDSNDDPTDSGGPDDPTDPDEPDPYHHDEYLDDHDPYEDPHYHPDHEHMDLAEEDEQEDVSDDHHDFPGEHQNPDDPDYDPLLPDEDRPDEEKDRK